MYSATGLPAGLAIDPQTGFISGTISDAAVGDSPYQVSASATDGFETANADFQWIVTPSYSLINPGTLVAPEGLPLNLLIHVDNPTNRSLSFSAFGSFGIPGFLNFTKLDDNTAAFQGTVYFYGGTYYWPITVYATDGISTVSTSFNIQTLPGVGVYNPGSLTSYVDTNINIALVNNLYGHAITVSSSGLPAGVSISGSGLLSGTLATDAFNDSPYEVLVTVTDHTISYSHPFSFQWSVLPQYPAIVYHPGDQTRYVGNDVDLSLYVDNQFNHVVSVGVGGLPAGVTFDEDTYQIGGTIASSAVSGSPYTVVITVTDHTLGAVTPTSFQWTVLPPLSLADLNAGTPSGVPYLVHLVDPELGTIPHSLTPVTYDNLPGGPTLVYFLSNDQLWTYDGDHARLVESIDPDWPAIEFPYGLMAVPGRGIVFQANGLMWFADQQGARVVSPQPMYPIGATAVTIGDTTYFSAYDETFSFNQLWRIRFDIVGTPIVEPGTSVAIGAVSDLTTFAGRLAFVGTASSSYSPMVLYWLDPTTDTLTTIASSEWNSWPPAFSDLTVSAGLAGSEKLSFLENTLNGRQLRVLDSTELASPELQPATLATFDPSLILGRDSYPSQPLVSVADAIVFSELAATFDYSQYYTQFWVSDGSLAGTTTVGDSFVGYNSIFDQTSFGGAMYFVYQPGIEDVPESMTAVQIWKLDPVLREFSNVLEFLTRAVDGGSPSDLFAASDKLYFTQWDTDAGAVRLRYLTADNTTPVIVPAKDGNAYSDPQLNDAVLGRDVLYFTAHAESAKQWNGFATPQLWALGSLDRDADGVLDSIENGTPPGRW